jgi:cytochrome c5
MGKSKTVSNVAAGAAVAICLSTVQVAKADGNPFEMQTFQKGGAAGQKLAQGMCGGQWQGMCGGRWGGMTEGMMMGGEMPRGVDPALLPEPQSSGARLVNQYCTQCHGLPSPALHSAPGWSPVAGRMNARMQWMRQNSSMAIAAPTPEELKAIIEYMQAHAAK